MRTVIIGDVHGCYDELEALLEKIRLERQKDRLIFIGDLMDRGPKSYEVLLLAKNLKETMGERCVYIRGNHEEMCLDHIKSRNDKEQWEWNGSQATIHSFADHGDDIKNHLDWIKKNSVYYYKSENYQCVHAGLFEEDPEENDPDTLIWERLPVQRNLYHGRLTIVGHTPFSIPLHLDGSGQSLARVLEEGHHYRLPERGLICIDTGCVYKGALSALAIEGNGCRIYQVKSGTIPSGH